MVRSRYSRGIVAVQLRYGHGTVEVWLRFSCSAVMVWLWFGHGMVAVRSRHGMLVVYAPVSKHSIHNIAAMRGVKCCLLNTHYLYKSVAAP